MEKLNTAKASLITVGDEILIGQIIDTNGAWLGQELTDIGIDIVRRISIGDDKADIIHALNEVSKNSNVVIITGGLGPTKDDVTKTAITEYFGVDTYFDEENFQWITDLFARYGRKPMESHRMQCYLPVGCQKVENRMGTAPGIHMEKDGVNFFFTPGVPIEMKYIFKNGIRPWIQEYHDLPPIVYRTILTAGQGESVIAEKIEPVTAALPDGVKIAFLPGVHQVRVRVLAQNMPEDEARTVVDSAVQKIAGVLGDLVFGFDNDSLAAAVGRLLEKKGMTLALAESCTGGFISHLITSIPGSSKYYEGSLVTYTNALKQSELGVSTETLESHGAVSEATVIEMAQGTIRRVGCDIALAVSGIAGPDGGTEDKPVGTVWMCVSGKDDFKTKCYQLSKTRGLNIRHTGVLGLNMIRKFLLGLDLA